MKTKLRIGLIASFFLLICFEGIAQNGLVTKTQDLPGKNTLIRAWNVDFSIGYTDDGSNQGYFFLDDIANKHLSVVRLWNDVLVSDFRVYNNIVYFCGKSVASNIGVVGWFDIALVFYGSGMIHYGGFPFSSYSYYEVSCFTKMDVFETGGIVHMASVGEMAASGPGPTLTTLCDVYYYGGVWVANRYNDISGLLDYKDIAASDRYVMAVAKKSQSDDYLVCAYNVSANFLNTPISAGAKYVLYGDTPLDDILIEDVGTDFFVLAHYYDSLSLAGTEFELLKVDGVNNTVVPQRYWQVEHGVSAANLGGRLRELHYDYVRQKLLLLHDSRCNQYSGIESVVIEHDVSSTVPGTVNGSYIHNVEMHGMDEMPNGYYQTIGVSPSGDSLTISHEWDENVLACRTPFSLPTQVFTLRSITTNYIEGIISPTLTPLDMIPIKLEVELDTYCE